MCASVSAGAQESEFYAIEVSRGAQNFGRELQGSGIARSCQSDCRLGAGLLCSDRFTAVYIQANLARTSFSVVLRHLEICCPTRSPPLPSSAEIWSGSRSRVFSTRTNRLRSRRNPCCAVMLSILTALRGPEQLCGASACCAACDFVRFGADFGPK